MNDLDKLAIKYGADKWGKHHYTPVYYDLFKDKRESIKKVLEIGVGEGASLRMWRDFFPNAQIYGADNDKERVYNLNNEKNRDFRIEVFECNQSLYQDLEKLMLNIGTTIDLVVDDGSHKPEDQVFTCLNLMPILWTDVTYVIEDVADENIAKELLKRSYIQPSWVNVKKVGERYDDRLIIVKHKNE